MIHSGRTVPTLTVLVIIKVSMHILVSVQCTLITQWTWKLQLDVFCGESAQMQDRHALPLIMFFAPKKFRKILWKRQEQS